MMGKLVEPLCELCFKLAICCWLVGVRIHYWLLW